jgi:hypothetical protein
MLGNFSRPLCVKNDLVCIFVGFLIGCIRYGKNQPLLVIQQLGKLVE